MKPLYPNASDALAAAAAALDDVVGRHSTEAQFVGITDDVNAAREALRRALEKYHGVRLDYIDTPEREK